MASTTRRGCSATSPCRMAHLLGRPPARAAPRAEPGRRGGLHLLRAPEIEFYLLKDLPTDGTPPIPADSGGFFDQASHDAARTSGATPSRRWSRWVSRWSSATTRAPRPAGDRPALRRRADHGRQHHDLPYVVKEVAMTQGVRASFMPKPFTQHPGSAMHTTSACSRATQRLPRPGRGPTSCPRPARPSWPGAPARQGNHRGHQPVRELLQAAGRRGEAPTTVCWGHANRSALVRVPMYSPGRPPPAGGDPHPGQRMQPLPGVAAVLGAGLTGVQKGYELGAPAGDDVWSLTEIERRAMATRHCRRTSPRHWPPWSIPNLSRRSSAACVRLLPAQQAQRVGCLPAQRHPYELQTYLPVL